jgi:hypothetical protein
MSPRTRTASVPAELMLASPVTLYYLVVVVVVVKDRYSGGRYS